MKIIDNRSVLLGDDLKNEIKEGSKLRIAAAYFSIYAYQALKDELEKVDSLKFIFTTPTFVQDKIKDSFHKEIREFYIPKINTESVICGTEFEIKLRNQMTQRAVARECAEWIRRKAKFMSVNNNAYTQNMIDIENDGKSVDYTPINGFTTSDLGYEKGENNLVTIIKAEETKDFLKSFDNLWDNGDVLEDVTANIVDYITSCYTENSPEYIYFLTLYNIFREFVADLYGDAMPNEATGFKNSLIWQKLYNFQRDGVVGIINKLEKYNGCILADSVGLGKTFSALAVMQYYSLRNKSILVLCPKRLASNWNAYRGNTKTNVFYNDRIRYDVLYHTDLGRTKGYSNGIDLKMINWGNYDLVVIDESHNFRNANTVRGKETRYDFLMNHIMKEGVKTKVLMLSATPVNNRYNDLKNQLALAYCGDFSVLNKELETTKSVQSIFANAQKAFNKWSKLPIEQRKAKDLIDSLDIDFTILLDSVTIARSRKHIQKYYNTADIGNFPSRLPVKSLSPELTDIPGFLPYQTIYQRLIGMTMNVYAPLSMLFDSRKGKYEEKYAIDLSSEDERANTLGQGFARQSNRETGIKKLMTISLLKRLESSVYSFRMTLDALINKNNETIDLIDRFQRGEKGLKIKREVYDYEALDPDEDGGFELQRASTGKTIEIDLEDIDVVRWRRDLEFDVDTMQSIAVEMKKITVYHDTKLRQLKELIDEKVRCPINAGNRKVLIFSAFADTTDYLYQHIAEYVKEKYGMVTAKIQGGNKGNACSAGGSTDTDRLLALFSPLSKERALLYPKEKTDIDVLIGTDCISEGQNLQDCDICINYDIHWNPVRIVQRFGRIDRIGSKNDKIQLVNFWPPVSLDEYIDLNRKVNTRMTILDAAATGDDNIIADEQEEMDYRKEQLKKMMDGKLQDLEDVDGSISITDLGLNEFRMDMVSYLKEHGEPRNVPKGLHAVIKADESKGIERGIILVLCNRNNAVNIKNQNRLHPYYLVYLKESGEVVFNHLQVKDTLDVLRTSCKGVDKPIDILCRQFNRETKDGAKMDKYSRLLDKAVQSIIDVKEENDLHTLFTSGSKVLFDKSINGLDDFELITFFVVR